MKGYRTFRALSALGLVITAITVGAAQPTQLAFWNFNEKDPLNETAMLTPEAGVFAAQAQISISLAQFRFNNSGGGFVGSPLDPGTDGRNWGLQTTEYPAQGQDSGQAGIVVSVPTTGYRNIVVKFDVRWSNTASRFLEVQYTTNGSDWMSVRTLQAQRGDRWHGDPVNNGGFGGIVQIDLSNVPGVNNNARFAFRVVTIFAPGTNQYAAAQSGSQYTTRGTLRYDLIEVLGTPIPSGSPGDANGDGCVNDVDLLVVLFNLGGSGQGDVNNDGTVNEQDALAVLFNFGQGC